MRRSIVPAVAAAALFSVVGQSEAQDGAARFDAQGRLERPTDYRQWPFLSSGLGMTYGPNSVQPDGQPRFSNVFVNPDAYRAFMASGEWPNGTLFVLEIRDSIENASINNGGRTQGAVAALEVSLKDTTRYPDGGWAYFDFPMRANAAAEAPLPRTASCYSCHSRHGAVDWTFTQFYPDQFAVAQRLGTVRSDYDPNRKASVGSR